MTVDAALDLIFKRLCDAFRLKPDAEPTGGRPARRDSRSSLRGGTTRRVRPEK
jgi:hypothetical protein